ncbi:DUF6434 domain-containing protein [Fastidiosibacter lacustris]|uniref:DUF6434 domain-containing protein n=1 Tax=Fastidiosibacter lacustris TaxID=2056695 RepID=UPI000E350433|nr:DUF6434 domain-containing protein [Fastidiosibacter lacustris]
MFQEGIYYHKVELIEFCKQANIPYTNLSKLELEYVLKHFAQTGKVLDIRRKTNKIAGDFPLKLEAIISPNFKIGFRERGFFAKYIPAFKYNIRFNAWMKENKGIKTYKEAIAMYHQLVNMKNENISPQFKYMTYIRDFFNAYPDRSKATAIKCWKIKKTMPNRHFFEPSDLTLLEGNNNID